MGYLIQSLVKESLDEKLTCIETLLNSDVVSFYGPVHDPVVDNFHNAIRNISDRKPRLSILVTTGGGSAESVERLVNVSRYYYQEIDFIVHDVAFSAGTIFCMSGNQIYMNCMSCLGPIDPQVLRDKIWVPALGYIDKLHELIEIAKIRPLTDAELSLMGNVDMAFIRHCEEAAELAKDLVRSWLEKYAFKGKNIQNVSQLAGHIASELSSHKKWHSHGRSIGLSEIQKLAPDINIIDYTNLQLFTTIESYHKLVQDYINNDLNTSFIHSRSFF